MIDDSTRKYTTNRKKKILNIFFSVLFFIGLVIMFYPNICNYYYSITTSGLIENYNEEVKEITYENKEEILSSAKKYNDTKVLYKVNDIFSSDKTFNDVDYDNVLKLNDEGLIGYIEIPKIDVTLPIYHGTSDDVLNKGIGHLKGSSFPIGGEKTHTILAGHRGLPSAKLFTDINLLQTGDIFTIHVMDETLTYEVDKIDVVLPNQVSSLQINDDGDYITLVTCTPYAVNTHRLLVRGKRIANIPEEKYEDIKPLGRVSTTKFIILSLGILITFFLIIAIICQAIKYYKKSRQ